MTSKINIILAFFILGGCFWILYSFQTSSPKIAPTDETISTIPLTSESSNPSVPPPDATGISTQSAPSADTTIVGQVIVTTVPPTVSLAGAQSLKPTSYMSSGKVLHYQNRDFGYSFDLPNNLYYSGFGSQAGAQHTVGIQTSTSPDTLASATTRVYYFGRKILSEVSSTVPLYQDPAGKYLVVLLDEKYSIKIESEDIRSEIVQTILQTLKIEQ